MHPTLWALILATERHPNSIIACDQSPVYLKVQRGGETIKVGRRVLRDSRLLLTKQDHNAAESEIRQRSLEEKRRQARRDAEINRQIQQQKRRLQGEIATTTAEGRPPTTNDAVYSARSQPRDMRAVQPSPALSPLRSRTTMSAPAGPSSSSNPANTSTAPQRPAPHPPSNIQSAPAIFSPMPPEAESSGSGVQILTADSSSYDPWSQLSPRYQPAATSDFRAAVSPTKAVEDILKDRNPYRNGTSLRYRQPNGANTLVQSLAG